MKTSYDITSDGDEFALVKAKTRAAIFGRRCSLLLSSYQVNGLVAITLEIRPDDQAISDMSAAPNGMLRIPDGSGGHRRVVEQSIDLRPLHTTILSLSDIANGAVQAGRFVSAQMLRRLESVVEHLRRAIRQGLSNAFFDRAIDFIDERYGDETEAFLKAYLGQLHWQLLLMRTGCGEECLGVIDYTLNHNPPSQYRIDDERTLAVEALGAYASGFSKRDVADAKATVLLRRVCGEELAQEFERDGKITVFQRGYRFVIRPGQFVKVFDKHDVQATLCIHTFSFNCNPIDELSIAYLNIKHRFDEYWRTAIMHGCGTDFLHPKLSQKNPPAAA